jgi:hypothetical protein
MRTEQDKAEKRFIGKVAAVTIIIVGIGCTIAGIVIGKTN